MGKTEEEAIKMNQTDTKKTKWGVLKNCASCYFLRPHFILIMFGASVSITYGFLQRLSNAMLAAVIGASTVASSYLYISEDMISNPDSTKQ